METFQTERTTVEVRKLAPLPETPDTNRDAEEIIERQAENAISLHAKHATFVESIRDMAIVPLPGMEERQYQMDALSAMQRDILGGHTSLLLVVGTGGGKTTMAHNFLAGAKGQILWMAPSNVALKRAIDELKKLGIKKS